MQTTGRSRFLNRELSWRDFNERVLALAEDGTRPSLERAISLVRFSRDSTCSPDPRLGVYANRWPQEYAGRELGPWIQRLHDLCGDADLFDDPKAFVLRYHPLVIRAHVGCVRRDQKATRV